MYLRPVSGVVVLLLILYSSVDDAVSGDPANPISEVLINCGSVHNHETLNGRRWFGDEQHTKSKFSDWWLQIKGSSTSSNHKSSISAGVYRTARISGSRFLYVIRLNPGQVILRLHFNPTSYKGFTSFQDLFTVEAAQFTLLGNFSASLTAHALGATTFTKDFSISIGENIPLIIVFTPSVSRTTYAFVNGIEIVYVPEHLTYFGEQEHGTYVVGEKSVIYVSNNTALEIIHQFKVKQGDLSPNDEFDMFGEWGTTAQKQHTDEIKNITWRRSVHAGFRYLVRVHFSKQGLVMAKSNNVMFNLLINQNIVQTRNDIVNALIENEKANCCYRDYLMVIKGRKQDPQREILIFLESSNIFMDGYGLVQGFEMLKLSNADNSLASPNPCPPAVHAPCSFLCYLGSFLYYLLGSFRISDLLVSLVLVIIIPLIIGTHRAARPYMRTNIPDTNNSVVQTPETRTPVLKNNPPAKAARKGRKFSLAQIIDATQNFSNEHIIGHGGFGTVYIGQIDEDTVAIKRHNSARLDQGEKEFWAEVETLSELRHLNLVSLIGHCNECGEMILVYQYMPNGTLEDHLFKPANGSEHWSPLTWKQRLQICIGAARGIEYLHTGTEKGVLHRDIKASNILLDENFIAKVSDFGLARPEVRGNSGAPFSTEIKGTYGYMDPDYMQNGEPSRKIDIYAFGVVLLEVLSGISVIREKSEFLNLLKKVQNKISSKEVEQLVASSLKGEIPKASLNLFFDIAQKCVHKDPKDRMQSMAHVVAKLQLELAKVTDEQPKGNTAGDKDGKLKANKTLYDYLISRGWKKKSSKGNETVPKASSGSAPGCSTSNEPDSFDVIVPLESNSDYRIALVAVQAATNNFDESRLIGVGGFGEVYKGVLNGLDVAVKRGKQPREQCGNAELNADIEMLCQIRHEHLVPLIGYCDENNENILVYEYMENGSLKSHLYDKNLPTLGWKERVEICIGVAKGLLHLHKYHLGAVTHGDLRSSNIFLDKNNVARVSDSGLSRMRPENAQNIVGTITHEMGTTTVVDDHFKKPPTKRSDTYWLGILFWEVRMGRRVADPSLPEDIEELAKRTMKLYDMEATEIESKHDSNLNDTKFTWFGNCLRPREVALFTN